MLILPPSGLDTAAERAFFAELTSWDTGGSVRGALVASLPLSDGPMDRRVADAVVIVPEGIAVVRVLDVVRQSGVVTVLPEGAWTIGPGAGPGDVLQLAGGGSTPLDGLMRAGMEAAVRLRRAGLEPGRIARLTVLHGELTGLVPADGDLGEGDQVSLLEPRSLLLGIARASRYAGTDNPRLWTTADVRAGLEALGVAGRSPSVEELNGEGFPYSPYVLRRRELLTPATLANRSAVRAAAPTAPPTGAQQIQARSSWPATGPGSSGAPVGGPNGPLVDPAAAGALAAAAVAAQDERTASAADPLPAELRETSGDTIALLGRPADTGAPARHAEPVSWHETQQIRPVSADAPPAAHDETGGIAGFFGEGVTGPSDDDRYTDPSTYADPGYADPPTYADPSPLAAPPVHAAPPRPHHDDDPPRRRRRGLLLVLAAAVLVVALGIGGYLLTQGDDEPGAGGGTDPAAQTTSAAPPTTTSPTPSPLPVGATQVVEDTEFTLQAVRYDTTCVGHAYGSAGGFFGSADCLGLSRSLWSADVDGVPAVVSVSRVTMPDATRAQALLTVTDTAGTGNVSDLLREGVRYPGGPEALSDAEYASQTEDDVAVIVETSWVADAGDGDALLALAENGRELAASE